MSADTAQPLGIGPELQVVSSFGYRGIRAGSSDSVKAPASSIEIRHRSISSISFELRGDTSQVEINPPGKVVFESFEIAGNTAPAPTLTAVSRTSGTPSGGTSVTLTVSVAGKSATNFTAVSSMKSGLHRFAISLPDCLRIYRGL